LVAFPLILSLQGVCGLTRAAAARRHPQPLDRERILAQIELDRIEVGIFRQQPHKISAAPVKALDRDFLIVHPRHHDLAALGL